VYLRQKKDDWLGTGYTHEAKLKVSCEVSTEMWGRKLVVLVCEDYYLAGIQVANS